MKKLTAEDLKRTSAQAQRYEDAIRAAIQRVATSNGHRQEDLAATGSEGAVLWRALQFVVARYLPVVYPKANEDEVLRRFARETKHHLRRMKLEERSSRDTNKL